MSATPYRGAADRRNADKGDSQASLHEIMTAPPMSAQEHADITRRRTAARRNLEDLRDRNALAADSWTA
jgi:hypothetical protein